VNSKTRIFWGWYIVFGAFLMLAITYGARYSFGVFVRPMFAEYHWPMSIISIGASLNVLIYATASILSGRIIDRFSPQWMITIGGILGAVGFFLTSMAQTPIQFYLAYGVMCGLGTACAGYVVSGATVGKWFVRKKGIAVGLAMTGIGFGTMTMSPLAGYVVKHYHWSRGFVVFGTLLLVVCTLTAQILMRRTTPEDYGLFPDGDDSVTAARHDDRISRGEPPVVLSSVTRNPAFWIMAICFSIGIMAEMMAFVHQVFYAVDINIGKIAAASSLGLIGVGSIFGRFFFGWLCDAFTDPKYSASLGLLFTAMGMLMLLNVSSAADLYIYSLVFGFGYGSFAPVMPALLSDRFGRDVLGSALGLLIFFATGIGGGMGPLIGGLIYDTFGTYTFAWLFNLIMLLTVSLLILTIKPKPANRR